MVVVFRRRLCHHVHFDDAFIVCWTEVRQGMFGVFVPMAAYGCEESIPRDSSIAMGNGFWDTDLFSRLV